RMRSALVAPLEPLPCWRRSIFLVVQPTMSPVWILPSRYPSTALASSRTMFISVLLFAFAQDKADGGAGKAESLAELIFQVALVGEVHERFVVDEQHE